MVVTAVAFVAGGLARLSFLRTRRGALTAVSVLLLAEVAIFRARFVTATEWAVLATVVAAGLVAAGLAGTRFSRASRGDVLVSSTVFLLAESRVLQSTRPDSA